MRKVIGLSVVVVALYMVTAASGAWRPIQWVISYDGSLLPTDSGSIKYGGTPWTDFNRAYAQSLVYATDGNIFHMSTIGSNGGADMMWSATDAIPSAYNFNSTTGYTVEVRMKIDNATAKYSGASELFFEESGKAAYWNIGVAYDPCTSQQYVALGSDTVTYVAVTPGWHVYRVTATSDNIVRLYIDGAVNPAATRAMYAGVDNNRWGFGDLTDVDADWEIDYIAIDNTGAYLECNTTFLSGDVNHDCYVNFGDVKALADNWLVTPLWDYPWEANSDPTNAGWYYRGNLAASEAIVPIDSGNNAYEITMTSPSERIWWQTGDYNPINGGNAWTPLNPQGGAWNPHASGNTIEFRMKIVSDEGNRGTTNLNYYAFAALACDADLVAGQWQTRGFFFNYDSIVEQSDSGCSNCANYILFDCSQWHTYRLNYNGAGTAVLSYLNGNTWQNLLTSSVGRYWVGLSRPQYGSYYRLGNSEGWGGWGVIDIDYVYHNGPGCGANLPGDVNYDCRVNFKDYAALAANWLKCNELGNSNCLP